MPHRTVINPYRGLRRAHRYWRILFTGIAGSDRIGLDEIEFWDLPTARRRAAAAVSASGSFSGATGPSYAADGLLLGDASNDEIWGSNTSAGAIWYQFDSGLDNAFELAAIALARGNYFTTTLFGPPTSFDVQWSDDGATWSTLWSEAGIINSWGVSEVKTFYNPYYAGSVEPFMDAPGLPDFWLKGDEGVYSDAGVTPAVDGQGARQVTNWGLGAAFEQATSGNRPIFRTGGLNGKPYLAGNGVDKFFEDIALTVAAGLAVAPLWTILFVVDQVDAALFPAILGYTSNTKNSLYFRPTLGGAIRFGKAGWDHGDVTNPLTEALTVESTTIEIEYLNGVYARRNNGTNFVSTVVNFSQLLRHTGLSLPTEGFFKGRLYELGIWKTNPPSPLVLNRLSRYIRGKYGL